MEAADVDIGRTDAVQYDRGKRENSLCVREPWRLRGGRGVRPRAMRCALVSAWTEAAAAMIAATAYANFIVDYWEAAENDWRGGAREQGASRAKE